jgi:hypothetical protein
VDDELLLCPAELPPFPHSPESTGFLDLKPPSETDQDPSPDLQRKAWKNERGGSNLQGQKAKAQR